MLIRYLIKIVRQSFEKFWTDTIKDWLRKVFFSPKKAQTMECAEKPHGHEFAARAAPHLSKNAKEENIIRTECEDDSCQITFVIILHVNSADKRNH